MQQRPDSKAPSGATTVAVAGEPALPIKLAIDLGPLIVFFATNFAAGLYAATGAFMIATLIALAVAWLKYHKLPVMPLVTGVVVLVFGGLTLYLHDETFIKLKPTIVYTMFAGLLFAGLMFERHLLAFLFGPVFSLTNEGWRKLTLRWIAFFVVMAIVNEAVWRNVSTDAWVSFKLFGFLPLTFVFAMAQVPLLQRYSAATTEQAAKDKDEPPA